MFSSSLSHRYIHGLLVAVLLLGLLLTLSLGYVGSFQWLNDRHFAIGDAIFPNLSNLADSLIACSIVALIWARRSPWLVLLVILAVATSGITAQLFKRFLFADWQRPIALLGEEHVYFFPHERLLSHSFPSGHATTAFAWAAVLALVIRQRWVVGIVLLGCLAAYSRVYLGVHFLGDIVAGGALGYGFAVLWVWLYEQRWQSYFLRLPGRSFEIWAWVLTGLGFICFIVGMYNRYEFLLD